MNKTLEGVGYTNLSGKELRISAVILNWKRSDSVNKIVKFLVTRPYFDEVIIWNNNPAPFVCNVNSEKVRVVNSESNLKDRAKYEACSIARNDYCYYQDDDFNNRFFIDSLYHAFSIQPQRLHTLTDPITWYADWRWTYYDQDTNIHAQFGWIGGGAMFPKTLATNHLKHLDDHFTPREQELGDMAFSLLINQPIVRIQVGPLKLSRDNAFSEEPDFANRQLDMQIKVGQVLRNFGCPEDPLPNLVFRSLSPNILLFTSYLPIDFDYQDIPFRPDDNANLLLRTRQNVEIEKCRQFRDHCYSNALNPLEDRFWKTTLRHGDEWGIVLIKPALLKLKDFGTVKSGYEKEWELLVDTETLHMTTEQLFSDSFKIQNSLKFRYIGNDRADLALKVTQSPLN